MRRPPGRKAPPKPVVLTPDEIAFTRALVLHEDPHILVLNKPSGLSSQGGRGQHHTLDDLLWTFARSNGNRPRLIHRLDRDTSGVILTARTHPAAGFLGKALMAKQFQKTYLALVARAPDAEAGEIALALRREEVGREAYMRACPDDHPDAELARTHWRTLAETPEGALLELRPETGRMHQIRVHLAEIGAPIIGDARYGGALRLAGLAVPRVMLHAASLSFPHPEGGERTFAAPPPADFAGLARAAGVGS